MIVHYDEALTMSARIHALTGDPSWEARYRQIESQLDDAIREVEASSLGAQPSKQTETANEALVRMERRSFDLVREGRLEEARAELFSDEYLRQKAIYSDGVEQLGRQLAAAVDAAIQREKSRITIQFAVGATAIVGLIVGWATVVRLANRGMRVREQLDKIERDLDIARDIQRGLLPSDKPTTPGYELEGWSKPADQTGGDYFDWMDLPDGGTLITLADVTGHGIGPALIVAVCRAYLRATATGSGFALEEAISRVNDLLEMELPAGRFVTAAVGVLRPDDHEMSLLSAGQAPLFFYRAATATVDSWEADDLPLGVASSLTFADARRVRFEPGDALVLATDGFFEWANGANQQYGTQRLRAFVAAHAHRTPSDFIRALHDDVVAHAAGQAQPDDLTVVVIKRTAPVTERGQDSPGREPAPARASSAPGA